MDNLSKNHLNKIIILEEFLSDNLNIKILDFIEQNYFENPLKELFKRIIKNKINDADSKFLNEKLGSMKRFRDRRTPEEYACDLLLGWITEDTILKIITSLGYHLEIVSDDRKREFLKKPTTTPDLQVSLNNGKRVLVELCSDSTGFWLKTNNLHLREQKYQKVVSHDGSLLGLDFENKRFFITKATDLIVSKKIDSHFLFGGKPATEIDLSKVPFYPISNMKLSIDLFFKKYD